MSIALEINGKMLQVEAEADTPLLWVLRDELKMTGSKFGCGISQCGACTVHADGQPIRSCSTPIEALAGVKITTIEGLGGEHALQAAWVKHDVPQCGYCQSGQIMAAAPPAVSELPACADIRVHRTFS
jgi:isoquinoline 1-oxidoreductase alpha subunit